MDFFVRVECYPNHYQANLTYLYNDLRERIVRSDNYYEPYHIVTPTDTP